jgi:hypothetical protein
LTENFDEQHHDRPDKGKIKIIDPRVLRKENRKGFKITQASRLCYCTRYFTDSGIIGSKEFVSSHYMRFKHLFVSKNEKKLNPIQARGSSLILTLVEAIFYAIIRIYYPH